jgi:dTDP-glucose 4,6-dehydratase
MVSSLSGKTVLVTGADGFIGSHLTRKLVESGAHVRALVMYNSWGKKGWLDDERLDVLKNVEVLYGDIRDATTVRNMVNTCDYVLHLSSLIAIPYSYDAPKSYVDTNVLGAFNVLQACRESSSLVRLVHVSTSEVYGSAQEVPISERHPLVAQSPYAATKIAADKLAESYYLSFGLPVVTARPFNTFGPRQTARAVIPAIASQLLNGAKHIALGSLDPTRDFNYVQDTVNGIIALSLCSEAEGEVVNIGTGEEWSIAETVDLLREISGNHAEIQIDARRIRPQKSEVNRLVADVSKIHTLTGWKSEIPFKQGLEKTCLWISKNLDKFDLQSYSK